MRQSKLFVPLVWVALLFGVTGCGSANSNTVNRASSSVQSAPSVTSSKTSTPKTKTSSTPKAKLVPLTLSYLHMVGKMQGWGLSQGIVYRTVDGGKQWTDVNPSYGLGTTTPRAWHGYFWTTHSAYLVRQTSINKPLYLLYTHNDGKKWHKVTLPVKGFSAQLQFVGKTGYMMVSQGVAAGSEAVAVLRSQNGGATWQVVSQAGVPTKSTPLKGHGIPFAGDKIGISFSATNRGYLTGYWPVNGQAYFYTSTDGGSVWTKAPLSLPSALANTQMSVYPPLFFGSTGVLPVLGKQMVFFITQNDGATWTATRPTSPMLMYSFSSATSGYGLQETQNALGKTVKAKLLRFRNGVWNPVTTVINMTRLDFVSANTGFAIMSHHIYQTQDGGVKWHKLQTVKK